MVAAFAPAACRRGRWPNSLPYALRSMERTTTATSVAASVPLLDVRRSGDPLASEIAAAIERVCVSGQFVLGPAVAELERAIAAYCGAEQAVGCASGSDAVLLALMALDIGPGDEVIVPSFTFFATASAVWRLGARPVFADIERESYNLNPQSVAQAITPSTRAIVPVHLYGQCAAMDALGQLARRHSLAIVEDACQAIGAECDGRRAGSLGDVGCFSFYPTKNLGGLGDGGMLTTSSADLAERLRLLRGHGMQPRYYHQVVGINSRLDSIQAAALSVKLPHLDRWTEMRAENARRYDQLFAEAGLAETLTLPEELPARRHVWNQYVVRVGGGRRDALRRHLRAANIGTEIYYPVPLHQQECFRPLGPSNVSLEQTERAAREVLALPIFPGLRETEQQAVVDCIARFYRERGGHAQRCA